ncbi:MAG: ribbon-helix-helix protein, CopG family [Sedimentisphaerales bacterium]|nr:ribbon-helix-helix protein, CopG family [Sedimentisphaerales bacterium]
MARNKEVIKTETIIFRAPKTVVKSLDKLARIAGISRSQMLRRLVPSLSPRKDE